MQRNYAMMQCVISIISFNPHNNTVTKVEALIIIIK